MWKRCSKCKKIKPFYFFCKNKNGEFSLKSNCKECDKKYQKKWRKENKEKIKEYREVNKKYFKKHNEKYRIEYYKKYHEKIKKREKEKYFKTKYGITLKERKKLILQQNNKCLICNIEFNKEIKNNSPCIDHCHKTGKIRGIVCDQCNKGIGNFKDNIEILKNAILYLQKD